MDGRAHRPISKILLKAPSNIRLKRKYGVIKPLNQSAIYKSLMLYGRVITEQYDINRDKYHLLSVEAIDFQLNLHIIGVSICHQNGNAIVRRLSIGRSVCNRAVSQSVGWSVS